MLTTRLIKLFCSLCLWCTLVPASAMVMQLNVAQVNVASKDPSLLQPALQQALKLVLVKYSGNPNVMSLPDVQAAIVQSGRWVKRYAYLPNPSNKSMPWILQVSFDGKSLEQLLMNANQALWGADRPVVLSVIYVQHDKTVHVLGVGQQSALRLQVSQRAQNRGVPLLWPLFDMADQNQISINALPAIEDHHMGDSLKQYLLGRYATSVLLFGFVKNTDAGYEAQWSFWFQGQWWTWQSQGDLSDALAQGIDGVANRMAEQMAMMPVGNQVLKVWVGGVDSLSHYADVVNYLKSLGPVVSVDVADLQLGGLLLNINTQVTQSSLAQLINQDHQLSAILTPISQHIPSADLYYQWPHVNRAQVEEASDEHQPA